MTDAPWGDHLPPVSEEESIAQIEAISTLLASGSARVLDLGAGDGRVAIPLLKAGHQVTIVDHDEALLQTCRKYAHDAGVEDALTTHHVDFTEPWPDELQNYDLVCCLGNTFMTVSDVDVAVELLRQCAAALTPEGAFVVDDCPRMHFPELSSGNWQEGVTEDGAGQLVWAPDDAVFALRWGDQVDDDGWYIRDSDRPFRLWTMGALTLAARLARLSAPARGVGGGLLILRRTND